MKAVINSVSGFYNLGKAQSICEALNGSEDGWSYIAVDCKNGYGRVDAIDEDGEIVFKGMMV